MFASTHRDGKYWSRDSDSETSWQAESDGNIQDNLDVWCKSIWMRTSKSLVSFQPFMSFHGCQLCFCSQRAGCAAALEDGEPGNSRENARRWGWCGGGSCKVSVILLMVQKSQTTTTWDLRTPVNNGINYQPQLVSFPDFWTINSRSTNYRQHLGSTPPPIMQSWQNKGVKVGIPEPNRNIPGADEV